jgi:hypothetical protein
VVAATTPAEAGVETMANTKCAVLLEQRVLEEKRGSS